MIVPLIRSQLLTILRSCHLEVEQNHEDNWDYYSMVEDYLFDWYDGEDMRISMIGTPLGGKVPKLNEKENRICSIIKKITNPPIANETTVHGTDFTAEEVETIIELLKQYSNDIDVVVVMGLKHDYNTLGGWINDYELCDRTFDILPDEGYLNLTSSEIKNYFEGECFKSDNLVKYFQNYLSKGQ